MAIILCKECGKEISDKAERCPNCGCPVPNNLAAQTKPQKDKMGKVSGLSITALIFSILGCTFIIGVILAIIDLCIKDGRKKTCSIIALAISGLWFVIGVANIGNNSKPEKVGDINANTSIEANNTTESLINDAEPSITPTENKETTFKKGEIAELNGVQVTLTDYNETTGSEWNKPTDGNIFLLAEFEISNGTEKELAISSILSFDAYADDYVLNYSLSAIMEKEGNQLDGTIAAGKKMKGWIGWEVPQDYQNVEIHFTDNVWNNNKFIFLIEK